jgi:HlyD family secretion protein
MKKKSVLYVVIGIVILAAAVLVVNLTLRGNKYDTAVPVRAQAVVRGRLEDRVTGNGTFKPRTAITVTAQVAGEVETVRVKEGSVVSRGDLLLALRDDDYVLAVQKARAALASSRNSIRQSLVTLRAQYRSASSAHADAQRTFAKNKELWSTRAISEETYQRSSDAVENSRVSLQSAREQLNLRTAAPLDTEPLLSSEKDADIVESSPEVEQASLGLRSAEDNVRRCSVTAAMAGTVTEVKPSVGDNVMVSSPLVKIETLDDMLAEIQIDEVDIGKMHVGQAAEITSDSLIGQTLRGIVEAISPAVSSLGSTRAALVDVRVARDSAAVLRSGASCAAKITTSTKQDALLIPLSSFVTEENSSFVYLMVPTGKKNAKGLDVYTLAKRQVRTGVSDVNSVEVTDGLAEGDRVVAGGLKLLRDGVMVTARPE